MCCAYVRHGSVAFGWLIHLLICVCSKAETVVKSSDAVLVLDIVSKMIDLRCQVITEVRMVKAE